MRIYIQICCLALNGGSQNSYNSVRIPGVVMTVLLYVINEGTGFPTALC